MDKLKEIGIVDEQQFKELLTKDPKTFKKLYGLLEDNFVTATKRREQLTKELSDYNRIIAERSNTKARKFLMKHGTPEMREQLKSQQTSNEATKILGIQHRAIKKQLKEMGEYEQTLRSAYNIMKVVGGLTGTLGTGAALIEGLSEVFDLNSPSKVNAQKRASKNKQKISLKNNE